MLGRAEIDAFNTEQKKGSESLKTNWRSRKTAQNRRKILGIADKPLGIAEKCLEEPKSAQQRKKQTWQSSNVHVRGVLYLGHRRPITPSSNAWPVYCATMLPPMLWLEDITRGTWALTFWLTATAVRFEKKFLVVGV